MRETQWWGNYMIKDYIMKDFIIMNLLMKK